ncbi:MAG: GldG family protein [Candidatus Hydrogenedentes bacterium]|nr:GldG family protein [Candidatus Hydrogenedentota bacterium]
MGKLRSIAGAVSFLLLIVALNIVAVRRNAFTSEVLLPLGIAAAGAFVWILLTMVDRAGKTARANKSSNLGGIVGSLIFLGICIVVYAFVSDWKQQWDLTEEGRVDLAPQTVQILQGLTEDVTVYALFNEDIPSEQRQLEVAKEKARLFLERCAKISPHLKVEHIDPQLGKVQLDALGLSFADPRGSVAVKAGARVRTIPLGGKKEQPRLEERDFTNALVNVIQNTQPKIGFLSGHGENEISKPDLKFLATFLAREGYVAESMTIRAGEGGIEGGYDVIVIVTPETDYSVEEVTALDTYVRSGGRLLVISDVELAEASGAQRPRLLEWLKETYGILTGNDIVISTVDKTPFEITLMTDVGATSVFKQVDVPDVEFHGCYEQSNPITRNFDKLMALNVARSVAVSETPTPRVTGNTILRTLPYCWAETNVAAIKQGVRPTRDPQERYGSVGLAAACTLQTDIPIGDSGQMKTSRCVVIGDSDFVKAQSLTLGGHLNFIMNSFAWLTEREELIAVRPTGRDNQPIKLTTADETVIAWIAGMGVVQGVLLISLVVYLSRRRYR